MQKPAPTDHPIHELLRLRWSPRAFDPRAVEREKLLSLLEAARWAASSYNEQPWSFLLATKEKPDEFARLLDCLGEFNQSWAKSAPLLMLSVAQRDFARNQKPNRHALHDVGLATAQLVIQAQALGLSAHQMAGFDTAKARAAFDIPASHEPVAVIALGYAGDPETLPDDLRERERAARERKPLTAFVFQGKWGRAAPLLP